MNGFIKKTLIRSLAVISLTLCLLLFSGCGAVDNLLGDVGITDSASKPDSAKYKAADFMVEDLNGANVMLSDNFGKPIVVNFWATWCPPCKNELVYFNEAYAKYGGDIVFMMVNMTDGVRETKDGVTAFISENGYTFPVYFDTASSAASAYGISLMPLTLFIDANGNEQQRYLGGMTETVLNEYIEGLIGGDAQ